MPICLPVRHMGFGLWGDATFKQLHKPSGLCEITGIGRPLWEPWWSGYSISHRTPVFCRGEREWGWEPAFSILGDYKQGCSRWAPVMQSHMVLNGKSCSQVGAIFMVVSTCVGMCASWQDWPTSEPLWSACGLSHACATVQRPFSETAEGSGAVNHVIAAGMLFSIPH